ncbi:50S ribosomal subunit L30 [Venustampulla echinocandica]|uniref:Large ribosomal subunit protein mL46 n=1 Tax=Venustampulla echinocandica TaxID=2656787 RepID=A0A370TGY5_9HELO|nr:50S ribosomal subunit L30 [Venustampulla echinocandica]RDL34456.1 50S ribosomal subunit L30 [Venustampulla echinocandica]
MTASSRGSRAAASLIRGHPRVCSDCINYITKASTRRSYAVAASTFKPADGPTIHHPNIDALPPVTSSAAPEYKTKAGILLSRPPLLTRTLTPFEKAFFFYQKRLNERLAVPFSRYFYFKKDTPADADWKLKAKERGGVPARELGGYQAYGKLGWNDEILMGDTTSETEHAIEALVKDSQLRAVEGKDGASVEVKPGEEAEDNKIEKPLKRYTRADVRKDFRRLDRKLERTLYLLVQRKNGGWGFPAGELAGRENLHQAAERVIVQTAGVNMNTWVVGHVPIGHYVMKPRTDKTVEIAGEKTFFMKGRIMAGQANLEGNQFGLSDFRWATREEVERLVSPKYYSYVRNMLADR